MGRRNTRPGEDARAPLELPVGLRFKQPGEFVDQSAIDLSMGGMFVPTSRPHPVGAVLEFELRPPGEGTPIAGKAQVAWQRRRAGTPGEPAGMGIRFVELDDQSRRRVAALVAAHEAGGAPDLGQLPAAAAEPAGRPDAATPPYQAPAPAASSPVPLPAGRAESRVGPRPGRWLPWALTALLVALAIASWLWRRPAAEPVAAAAPITPAAAPAVERSAPLPDPVPGQTPAARPAPLALVDEWSRAWSEQRVDDYLRAYSARFEPPPGLTREGWERQRRARLLAPSRIEVALALIELEEVDADTRRVRFVQAYESDSYQDVVRKVLELELEADGWKIVRESVEP